MAFSIGSAIGEKLGFSNEAMAGAAIGGLVGGPTGAAVGFGLGNSMSSAKAAQKAQEDANAQNIAFAEQTNATAIELANTAHQREMADLKAAGLNPILSSKYGGASVPSLNSPSVESLAPVIQNSARQTQDAVSSGVALTLQQNLQKSQVLLNSAQAAKAGQEAQRTAYENDALAMESELRKREASHKLNRPRGTNEAGWDTGDFFRTIGKFLH